MPSERQGELASSFAEVEASRMHHIEVGSGRPILFLHGNPTSSYLWRNILPRVSQEGRCIALDLIGMGRSEKPDIEYRFVDHARYLEGFVEALGLSDLILVLHDWGVALGLDYACRHASKVRAVAMMEGLYRPVSWDEQTWLNRWMFRRLRHPVKGHKMIVDRNFFIEKVLPMMTVRDGPLSRAFPRPGESSADSNVAPRDPVRRRSARRACTAPGSLGLAPSLGHS